MGSAPGASEVVANLATIEFRTADLDWFAEWDGKRLKRIFSDFMDSIDEADNNVFRQNEPFVGSSVSGNVFFRNVKFLPLSFCVGKGSVLLTAVVGVAATVTFVTATAHYTASFLEKYPAAKEKFPEFRQDTLAFAERIKGKLEERMPNIEVRVSVTSRGKFARADDRLIAKAIKEGKSKDLILNEHGEIVEEKNR